MAITIIKKPSELSLSKNPIEYHLQTDKFITTPGSKAVLKLEMTANGPVIGDDFTIAWLDNSITFTVSATPDDSGEQIPEWNGSDELIDHADKLKDYLERNYPISQNFILSRTDPNGGAPPHYIFLTAKKPGSDFTITYTDNTAAALIERQNTAGVDTVTNENFHILLQIYIEDVFQSGDFEQKVERLLIPDAGSITIFDISSILHTFVEIDLPTIDQSIITKSLNFIKKYYVRFGEIYGAKPKEKEILKQNILNVLIGGTSFKFFNENSDFLAYLKTQLIFLTWQPDNKQVTEEQNEFLYFPITWIGLINFKFKTDIFYTDQTSDLNVLIEQVNNPNQFEIYIIPAGFNQVISNLADPNKTVDHYTVKVTNQDDILISVEITYFLYRKKHLETEYIFYKNSLGVFETLRCTGDVAKGINITKQIFQSILPIDYKITDSEFSEINVSGKNSLKLSTGFITKSELQHLQEFILSDRRFHIKDGQFKAVTLNTKKLEFFKTSNNLYAFSFEIEPAYNLPNYSSPTDIYFILFEESFPSGDFKNWIVANGNSPNPWFVGTAEKTLGDFGAYISNDNGASAIAINASPEYSHFYRDILFPSDAETITLSFNWKCEGIDNGGNSFAGGRVFLAPTSVTPIGGDFLTGQPVSSSYIIGKNKYVLQSSFISEKIIIDPANAGMTKRLIFSWEDRASFFNDLPFCLDEIRITYTK